MFAAKSTLFLAIFAVSTQLAVAVPPACLLAAINTEEAPADLPTVCGPHASQVKSQIRSLCGSNTNAAMTAFEDTCNDVSTVSSSSGSPSSTSSASTSDSASGYASTTDSASSYASTTSSPVLSTGAPYPVVHTSTYYDTVCSCTKSAHIISTGVSGGSSGFATGTAAGTASGTAGSTGTGASIHSEATGSPIVPTASQSATSPTSPQFTGAAPRSVGSFAAAALVAAAVALAI